MWGKIVCGQIVFSDMTQLTAVSMFPLIKNDYLKALGNKTSYWIEICDWLNILI